MMPVRLGRSLALALLLTTGSGCATRQGVGATIAGLGVASVLVATDDDPSTGQTTSSTDQDTRIALVFAGATAFVIGSVLALAPSHRPARPAPAAASAAAPTPTVAPVAPDAPAPDALGECPPQATCLPVTP